MIKEHMYKVIWKMCFEENCGKKLTNVLTTIIIIAEVVAFVINICASKCLTQCSGFLRTYKITDVIPIIAIAWGAVAIPIGYLLGKAEQRMYGIRFIDQLIVGFGEKNVCFFIISLCSQILFMTISVACDWKLAFIVIAIAQMMYVFIGFYIVCWGLSYKALENTIEEQDELLLKDINGKIDGVKKKSDNQAVEFTLNDYVDQMILATNIGKIDRWLILEVIKNISFEKKEDIDKIKALLKSVVDLKYKGVAKRKVVYYVFNELSARNDRKIVKEIIFELFIKNANTDSDTRKAILGALITQRNVWSQQVCLALLENYLDSEIDEKEDKRELILWTVFWGIYQKMFAEDEREKVGNELFIDQLLNLVRSQATVRDIITKKHDTFVARIEKKETPIIWQTCVDLAILEQTNDMGRIVKELLASELWIAGDWLKGGKAN